MFYLRRSLMIFSPFVVHIFYRNALLRFYVKRYWLSILITVWERSEASLAIIWYPGSNGNHIVIVSVYKEKISFVLDSCRLLISCKTLSWCTKPVLLKLINIDSDLTMMSNPTMCFEYLELKRHKRDTKM